MGLLLFWLSNYFITGFLFSLSYFRKVLISLVLCFGLGRKMVKLQSLCNAVVIYYADMGQKI